jgi:glycosyltransferase involved in cell wall biosynthesis
VLPAHGSFPEMIAHTGGGILHRPHDATDLANKLAELLRDSERARQVGEAGQQAIRERYHAGKMARQTLELYRDLVALGRKTNVL